MVFESIVSNLLNTFLGDYVENLDSSQLNIGIWGGDVVLNNLNIRPTALVISRIYEKICLKNWIRKFFVFFRIIWIYQ